MLINIHKVNFKGEPMRPRLVTVLLLLLCLIPLQSVLAASDPHDSKGSKDLDLFSRMPGWHIYR